VHEGTCSRGPDEPRSSTQSKAWATAKPSSALASQRAIGYFTAHQTARRPAGQTFPQLTARELEVLELVAAGLNNTEIANKLVLSLKTVRNHVSNIFAKLQVAHRAQAIVMARKAGLGDEPDHHR